MFKKTSDGSSFMGKYSDHHKIHLYYLYVLEMVLSYVPWSGSRFVSFFFVQFSTSPIYLSLVFALLGFLSPSNRGSLATVMMVCWTFFGSIGGYISSRIYASLGGTDRRKNAFLTATILPTTIFALVFLLNLFLIAAGSSGAVPFGTMLFVVLLWFGISAPLSSLGAYFGSKHGVGYLVALLDFSLT